MKIENLLVRQLINEFLGTAVLIFYSSLLAGATVVAKDVHLAQAVDLAAAAGIGKVAAANQNNIK